ncbi:BFD-like (2Fe-2S) protein [Desulfobacteraceae bacterium SEEP-SAG9]|nr:BFD-like (2Fe-2S) protein [Desulfobacteraceae bacterium SEEP-SAG9]
MSNLICFCFNYSADDIEQDYFRNGHSTIMEKIKLEKKFGNCQCAKKSPKGR